MQRFLSWPLQRCVSPATLMLLPQLLFLLWLWTHITQCLRQFWKWTQGNCSQCRLNWWLFRVCWSFTHSVLYHNQTSAHRPKALVFDLMGEGNLPSITVLRPVQRTNRGQPVLQFKRLLVGRGQVLPLVIKNNGNVPAQVRSELVYEWIAISLTWILIGIIHSPIVFAD